MCFVGQHSSRARIKQCYHRGEVYFKTVTCLTLGPFIRGKIRRVLYVQCPRWNWSICGGGWKTSSPKKACVGGYEIQGLFFPLHPNVGFQRNEVIRLLDWIVNDVYWIEKGGRRFYWKRVRIPNRLRRSINPVGNDEGDHDGNWWERQTRRA